MIEVTIHDTEFGECCYVYDKSVVLTHALSHALDEHPDGGEITEVNLKVVDPTDSRNRH